MTRLSIVRFNPMEYQIKTAMMHSDTKQATQRTASMTACIWTSFIECRALQQTFYRSGFDGICSFKCCIARRRLPSSS